MSKTTKGLISEALVSDNRKLYKDASLVKEKLSQKIQKEISGSRVTRDSASGKFLDASSKGKCLPAS